jgi:predicted DsbA family dithiol-disulfide isomerase
MSKITKQYTLFLVSCVMLLCLDSLTPVYAQKPITHTKKMKVEIWSDVMCPFCYIGKRKFESALAQFEHKDDVEVVWKSFQLQPDMVTDPSQNTIEHLAKSKGWTLEHAREMTSYVVKMASEVGLNYNFDKAVVANSFDAHRVVQLAKTKGKGDAMEEQLFKAYFIDGKNTADHTTLTQLATEIGLDETEVKQVLSTNAYADNVKQDIYESQQIGVTGVPFFVLNNKYAVSGAQASETFLGALQKAWSETIQKPEIIDGAVCTPDGKCD